MCPSECFLPSRSSVPDWIKSVSRVDDDRDVLTGNALSHIYLYVSSRSFSSSPPFQTEERTALFAKEGRKEGRDNSADLMTVAFFSRFSHPLVQRGVGEGERRKFVDGDECE